MELNEKKIQEAREQLQASLGVNTEIVEHSTPEDLKLAVESIGQNNTTALGNGEYAEFFKPEEYEQNIDKYVIHTESTSRTTGRTFGRLYALANRYFLVGKKRVGEHFAFIDVGGMVRRHFDISGLTPDAEGRIKNARRVVTPGVFNEKLHSYRQPWNMLTEYLGGKTVTAKTSTDKLFFQEFTTDRQPVPDKYVERNYMVYDFAKSQA